MAIIANAGGYSSIVGIIPYPPSRFADNITTTIDVASDINTDLVDLVVTGIPVPFWTLNWYLQLNCSGLVNNPAKFIGAYNRLNYGVVDYSYRGAAIGGEYWNYQCQRSENFTCRLQDRDFVFPTNYIAPPVGTVPGIIPNSANNPIANTRLCSELGIRPISALAANVSAQIYYFAEAFNVSATLYQASI